MASRAVARMRRALSETGNSEEDEDIREWLLSRAESIEILIELRKKILDTNDKIEMVTVPARNVAAVSCAGSLILRMAFPQLEGLRTATTAVAGMATGTWAAGTFGKIGISAWYFRRIYERLTEDQQMTRRLRTYITLDLNMGLRDSIRAHYGFDAENVHAIYAICRDLIDALANLPVVVLNELLVLFAEKNTADEFLVAVPAILRRHRVAIHIDAIGRHLRQLFAAGFRFENLNRVLNLSNVVSLRDAVLGAAMAMLQLLETVYDARKGIQEIDKVLVVLQDELQRVLDYYLDRNR